MTVDITKLAQWASALIAIVSFAKLIVSPFISSMKENQKAMGELKEAIKNFKRDVEESVKDRRDIRIKLSEHDKRIGKNEDDIIVHTEQIKTLFDKVRG